MLPGPEEEAQTSDQVRRFLGTSVPRHSQFRFAGKAVVYFPDFNEILPQTRDRIWPCDSTVC